MKAFQNTTTSCAGDCVWLLLAVTVLACEAHLQGGVANVSGSAMVLVSLSLEAYSSKCKQYGNCPSLGITGCQNMAGDPGHN